MSSTNIYQPYTYLIGWSKHNKWYYGVQYGTKANPNNLWKTYFTSSKKVKEFRTINGEPDIIEIRKTFNSSESAKLWEDNVLLHIPKDKRNNWLNLKFGNSFRGVTITEEMKYNWSITRKGVPKSEQWKQKVKDNFHNRKRTPEGLKHAKQIAAKMGKNNLGRKHSTEVNASKGRTGKRAPHSDERKSNISKSYLNRPELICPHCGKSGKPGAGMYKWHFNNCSKRPEGCEV